MPASIVALLHRIDRAAGAESSHLDQLPQLLDSLRATARIESVTASSAIEGVVVDDSRLPGIVAGRTEHLRTRSEEELAGYTTALDHLYQDDPGDLSVGSLLHLHRLLFSRTTAPGGQLKSEDNLVVNREPDGSRTIRFKPVSAHETPHYTAELIERTNTALAERHHHPLLVVAALAFDLSCIHPFTDGNGRVVRLVTTHLLTRMNYRVGRYVSVEQLIYDAKNDYYDALARSTDGWFDDGHHNLWPWAGFLLRQLALAYERFEARISAGTSAGSKKDRVRDLVLWHSPATFTINDIRRALPGISDPTIRLVLAELRDAGKISAQGTGRSAVWHRH